jgi:quercetin dioxygenase-like cupin family protein
MKIFDFGSAVGRPLTAFGSSNVWFAPVLRRTPVSVVCMRVAPRGTIAAHPAAAAQLFLVVEGEGWVRSAPGDAVAIKAGQAAFWQSNESHESGSETGMVVIIVEGPDVQPELPPLE